MILFQITSVKDFMKQLLTTTAFDSFLLVEATVVTFQTIQIDGTLQRDFFRSDASAEDSCPPNAEEYVSWEIERPVLLQLIKGSRTPLSLQFVLRMKKTKLHDFQTAYPEAEIQDGDTFYLNIRYLSETLQLTTGVARTAFTLDKSAEVSWDQYVKSLLHSLSIDYTE